ncbi:MAG: helix-hairpin-helix domain-containing protein [Thermomicrobiales bacterium]
MTGTAITHAASPATPSASPSPVATPAFTKVNLNTATDEEILASPGTGDRMLKEFKEYRPYTSIVQFRQELGKYVGNDQVTAWEAYVYVPVDPNTADAETLKQLPGVDDTIAQKLIDGRSYASNDAFLKALASLVSPADAAAAAPYLQQS